MAESKLPIQIAPASEMLLPSGRSLRIGLASGGEQLEILSPEGNLELRIAMTPEGPILSLSGARLELNATESVALNCGKLEINAANGIAMRSAASIQIESGAEVCMRADGDANIDAQIINLNCGDRTDYNDPVVEPPPLLASPSAKVPDQDCGCKH